MDECASGGKDDAMGDRTRSRSRRRQPILDVLEARGLLTSLGGIGPSAGYAGQTSFHLAGHAAVVATRENPAADAADPPDSTAEDESSHYVRSDDHKSLLAGESPDSGVREDSAVGVSKEGATAGLQPPGTLSAPIAVSLPSGPSATDGQQTLAAQGSAPALACSPVSDGSIAQRERLAGSPSGHSVPTGGDAAGANWQQARPRPARASAISPDAIDAERAHHAEKLAADDGPLPPPQGNGLIAHLPELGYAAIEQAFDDWFAQFEETSVIVGSFHPNATHLVSFSLAAAAIVAGIAVSRRVRRGDDGPIGDRPAAERGRAFLEFPDIWSPRYS
jgi:hypothetical protein